MHEDVKVHKKHVQMKRNLFDSRREYYTCYFCNGKFQAYCTATIEHKGQLI